MIRLPITRALAASTAGSMNQTPDRSHIVWTMGIGSQRTEVLAICAVVRVWQTWSQRERDPKRQQGRQGAGAAVVAGLLRLAGVDGCVLGAHHLSGRPAVLHRP